MIWSADRFRFGVCNVEDNYRFYFKWLTSKMMNCIVLKNVPETIDIEYLKEHLLLGGEICITDFKDELYACIGSLGGEPNEYYRPSQFIIANPKLGSKTVNWQENDANRNGVVVFNTPIDSSRWFDGGLYQLVKQTATLLADNIVSINCAQINSRVEAIYTADSQVQATEGEIALKKLYAGTPYQILRQDVVKKIGVNPIATASTSNKIKELIELHQYIIAQFFQAIGIKANAVNKKERMITDEINSQDDYLAISLLDIVESWKSGFEQVNKFYGTNIEVEVNPVLAEVITAAVDVSDDEPMNQVSENIDIEPEDNSEPEETKEPEAEPDEPSIEEVQELANEVIDAAADTKEGESDETEDTEN